MPALRRTTLLIVLVTAAATVLALATGAAVVDEPADSLAEDRLAVQPADGPNGAYAYLNDDDEIVVDMSASNHKLPADFEGVDSDALASAAGVFTIRYTADEYARVWIEHSDPNVTFVADGTSIEGKTNSTTLAPNETVAVGLRVDASAAAVGATLGGDDFDIRAEIADPADLEETDDTGGTDATTVVRQPAVDRRTFTGTDLPAGEPTTFDADRMTLSGYATLDRALVTSATGGDIEFSIVGSPDPVTGAGPLTDARGARPEAYFELNHSFTTETVSALEFGFSIDRAYLNETGADSQDVTLYRRSASAADGWEQLPTERVDPAVRRLLDLPADRVHYRATTDEFSVFAVATEQPVMRAITVSLSQASVEPGEMVVARATITNAGGAGGSREVTLTVNGTPVATQQTTLEPNESSTFVFETRLDEPGTYSLEVGDMAETLVVSESDADSRSGNEGSTGAGIGSGDSTDSGAGALTEEPSGINFSSLRSLLLVLVLALVSVGLSRWLARP